jgi:uroporphyrinogen decarboxylase
MNMTQWLGSVRRSPAPKILPVLSFPGVQIIGGTVRDIVMHGEIQARCMKAIADRYPTLAAVSNMDLSVEAEAFGANITYHDDEVPSVSGRLVDTAEDARNLQIPAVGAGRTGECVKAISIASHTIKDRPVLAGVIGPFSLAGRLMEMTEIMYKAIDEPETVHTVLEKAASFLLAYIQALKKAGANGVLMAEPAAGLLSPDWNIEFSANYIKRIVSAVQDDQFLFVYHNCGNVAPLIPAIVATGAKAFHFGNAVSLPEIIRQIPADRLVLGNIDPARQIANGTPASINMAVRNLLEQMKGYPNHVLSSGCDIPARTPLANIDAFFRAADEYFAENSVA